MTHSADRSDARDVVLLFLPDYVSIIMDIEPFLLNVFPPRTARIQAFSVHPLTSDNIGTLFDTRSVQSLGLHYGREPNHEVSTRICGFTRLSL